MNKRLPLWADKTCEDCFFEIDGRCRHRINDYGYTQVLNHGKYRQACGSHIEADKLDDSHTTYTMPEEQNPFTQENVQ